MVCRRQPPASVDRRPAGVAAARCRGAHSAGCCDRRPQPTTLTHPLRDPRWHARTRTGAGCDPDKPRWIIDPLDGTTNFLHGIPHFAISIAAHSRLLDGIMAERELMSDLRASADLLLDTSGLNVHQLSAKIASMLHASISSRTRLAVMSFGFKYGVPLDADFVMDMRFLPNPFWVPELRPKNGKDPDVAAFVLGQEGAQEVLELSVKLLDEVTAGYQREGRRYATVAVGCTGGKHRSVAMAEALADRLAEDPTIDPFVVHRDLGRE